MKERTRRREDQPLAALNSGGDVGSSRGCPDFAPCGGTVEQNCWYCVYADFHLDKPHALDVGVCNWPNRQTQ